jgi:hypothetical protein
VSRREAAAEEAGILAAQTPRTTPVAPGPVRAVSCVRCRGTGEVFRGREPSMCPVCTGTGEPVTVAVIGGRAVRITPELAGLGAMVTRAILRGPAREIGRCA